MRRQRSRIVRCSFGAASLLALVSSAMVASGPSGASTTHGTVVTVTFQNKGATVHLHGGERLRVVLGSTYWSIKPSSNSRTLSMIGSPKVVPQSGCVRGAGCGTVTAMFKSLAPGTATVSASRDVCGEDLACSKANGTFNVFVRVT
jgi:hypothetical protein